jgi:hypothetical protein
VFRQHHWQYDGRGEDREDKAQEDGVQHRIDDQVVGRQTRHQPQASRDHEPYVSRQQAHRDIARQAGLLDRVPGEVETQQPRAQQNQAHARDSQADPQFKQ